MSIFLFSSFSPADSLALTHVSKQTGDGLDISAGVHVAQLVDYGQAERVDSDPPLACENKHKTRLMFSHPLR